jgi:hypothetical protein
VRKDVAANITAGRNTAWLRLNDANSSEIATDYSGLGFDGTYQNGPILGQKSVISGETDTCMDVANVADQRMSLPYKHLLTGWPLSVEMVFKVFPKRDEFKFLVGAFSLPSLNAPQSFQVFIASSAFTSDQGKIVALITSATATGTQSVSTITVDDGVTHHLAIVMPTSNSLRIWIDGSDVTHVTVGHVIPFPDDLVTGYSIANMPSVVENDFGLNAGFTVDSEGNDVTGGIQSVVFYDGMALSTTRIQKHAQAATVGWATVSTGSRVDQVLDTLGYPVADRAVDAGIGIVGNVVSGGTPLAYLQLVAETEGGRFFVSPEGFPTFHSRTRPLTQTRSLTPQAVFDDNGGIGTVPYVPPFDPHLDDVDVVYRANVTRVGGSPQIFDATPGSTQTRTLTKSGLLMTTDAQARGMAQYDVSVGKTSRQRIRTLTFQPHLNPTVGWPAALGLRQGDRVSVHRHFEGGYVWSSDWIVEGIKHDNQSGTAPWQTELALSPADPASYFKLGTSVLGGTDRLFY